VTAGAVVNEILTEVPVPMMQTEGRRGLLSMKWFLGALGILLLALLLEAGLLAYAIYVLLGLLLVSRFLAREWIGRLRAERQCHG